MSCEHDIIFEITDTDDVTFDIDVRDFVDRIVAPDEYSGATVVTPSDSEQFLPTKDKTVRANITVNPAPVESLATSENGTFLPSSGNVGFSEVVVDVEPSLESLSVTENGLYLPESGTDGFDRVSVDVPIPTFETEEKTVTENGVYYPSAGKDGISKVTVDVPSQAPVLDSLSVTANGTYTPSAGIDGFNEVVVNVPTGGGGGGLTLLNTIDVNGVRGIQVNIDATWYNDCDYVVFVPSLTFSASDWLYIVNDATSGGGYAPQSASADISYPLFLYHLSGGVYKGAWFRGNTTVQAFNSIASYLYWYLYGSSNTMTGTIKIYGIKVTS